MHCAFVIPGSFDARTGGTIYDKKIVGALRARGWTVDVRGVASLESVADGTLVLVDGLSYRDESDMFVRHASRLSIVALVHLPLALEPGLDAADAQRLRAIERRVLAGVKHVIVTGPATRDLLDDYGVTRDRITVVGPGTDPATLARGSGSSTVRLLTVAAVTAGKGHELLVRALAAVPHRDWTLTCAGSLTRQPAAAARVREVIAQHRLNDRIALAGELDETALAEAYHRADLFVLATVRETYGMAVAEAIARGLPVVSTKTGAIAEIVGDAGLLVATGDEKAMSDALACAIGDASARAQLAAAARVRRSALPTWDTAAVRMIDALQTIGHERIAR
jgi:glycosyltransferase involved in cell wall biosynthesis